MTTTTHAKVRSLSDPDAWVVGDEQCVLYDLGTADDADFGEPPVS